MTRRNTVQAEAPSETAACSMRAVHARGEAASTSRSAKGMTMTTCAQHQAEEGAAKPDLREEAQERDAEHDMRDHQRRHEQAPCIASRPGKR